MSFDQFGLLEKLVKATDKLGYKEPTPIQAQAIPAVLKGKDLLAGAQTGTGKTAGFVLPMLHLLESTKSSKHRPIRGLIITPTRELAAQVEQSVRDYSQFIPIASMVVYGGVKIGKQIKRLNKPTDILVATPGRLLDHVSQGTVDLSGVEILVLDEADRMLDMGFIRDIKKILALLPRQRQNLLFSATFSPKIKTLANSFLKSPELIEVAKQNAAADTVTQKVYLVDKSQKRQLLEFLIKDENWHQVLVFARTRHGANRLSRQLDKAGIPSLAIHGDRSQAQRTKALKEFKLGNTQVLVATDVAARGIDIDHLPHVVNFDLPNVPEDYVHRIGRTGRAGKEGEAASLVCADEHLLLADIEKLLGRELPTEILNGFAPQDKPKKVSKKSHRKKPHNKKAGNKSANNKNNRRRRKPKGEDENKKKRRFPKKKKNTSEADGNANQRRKKKNSNNNTGNSGDADGNQRSTQKKRRPKRRSADADGNTRKKTGNKSSANKSRKKRSASGNKAKSGGWKKSGNKTGAAKKRQRRRKKQT